MNSVPASISRRQLYTPLFSAPQRLNTTQCLGLLLGLVILLTPVASFASDAPAANKPMGKPVEKTGTKNAQGEKNETKTVLFNGENLNGWKTGDYTDDVKISLEGKNLVIPKGGPISAAVWSGKPLPTVNYELVVEAQRVAGNDFFATVTFPYKDSACSFVVGGWGGGLTGLSSLNGIDASENETVGYKEFKNGQWYTIRIKATDERIICYIDDEKICDVTTEDKEIGVRLEMEASKPLGIASYRTASAIRKVEIRTLKPAK